jgi:hypothetical protein
VDIKQGDQFQSRILLIKLCIPLKVTSMWLYTPLHTGAHPRGAAAAPKTEIKKNDFIDIMISKVLRDLPFSRNQALKSPDD